MFKTLIIFIALNFWVIEGTPNPGRSFPHWRASMPGKNFLGIPDVRRTQQVSAISYWRSGSISEYNVPISGHHDQDPTRISPGFQVWQSSESPVAGRSHGTTYYYVVPPQTSLVTYCYYYQYYYQQIYTRYNTLYTSMKFSSCQWYKLQ